MKMNADRRNAKTFKTYREESATSSSFSTFLGFSREKYIMVNLLHFLAPLLWKEYMSKNIYYWVYESGVRDAIWKVHRGCSAECKIYDAVLMLHISSIRKTLEKNGHILLPLEKSPVFECTPELHDGLPSKLVYVEEPNTIEVISFIKFRIYDENWVFYSFKETFEKSHFIWSLIKKQ